MSECDSSNHHVSVVAVVIVDVIVFVIFKSFSTSLKTAARIYYKFCVDLPWVDPY